MNRNKPVLAVVVPCYNEEEVVEKTHEVIQDKILRMIKEGMIDEKSFVCFIDDGSRDDTFSILTKIAKVSLVGIRIIKLSRNFGHQRALLAGYYFVANRCDCTISVDCDLQDDIEIFNEFIDRYSQGYEIVFGVRKSRKVDTSFKRVTAQLFYKIMSYMCKGGGEDIVSNHADYRLLSNRILNELHKYRESNLFIRGIISTLGFKKTCVYYDRSKRYAGISKYPFLKMVSFAIDGITSFSIFPLRIIAIVGILCLIFAFLLSMYVLYVAFFTNSATPGWASITIPVSFFGGIQIFSIGVLGEYIGKIYQEVKDRPRYIIEEEL